MNVEEQLEILLRGTHFPDEGGIDLASIDTSRDATASGADGDAAERTPGTSTATPATQEDSSDASKPKGLRAQMTHELRERLKEGRPLRIYIGVDPTATSLHIGHFVSVQKLRIFQDLGHQVVFLIGDYTAMIGDPTGQSGERKRFTHEEVKDLAAEYTKQAYRLLDPQKTEVRYNGDWLGKLSFMDIVELASIFPLKWVVSRHDFSARLEKGESLRLHETMYCLMQGYDAYALECDVQVGGYDQYLNMLSGRWIQEHFGKRPHIAWTFPLLMGTDGRKMSKSFQNAINLLDSPGDMYGKGMRISDDLIPSYIDLTTSFAPAEAEAFKARLLEPGVNPMDVKKAVARNLVEQYHGPEAADDAEAQFQAVVQGKEMPDEIEELAVPDAARAGSMVWPDLLVELSLAKSKAEVRRLMSQGGFYVENESITDPSTTYEVKPETTIRMGKRRWYKLVSKA